MSPSVRIIRAAVVTLLVACVDGATGPGNYTPATLRLRITLPAGTPAAWTPVGETLHVAVRRAGRVEPIADASLQVVGDSLRAVLTVPLAYAVERFVVLGEARYGGLVLFLGFETVQLTAAADTTIAIAATYVGPGARAASYALAARDSALAQGDTASLLPDVRDSAGLAIANVPARYVATNPAVITVDAADKLTGQAGAPDTARIIGYLPMGLSSSLLVRRVPAPVPGAGRKTWLGASAVWSQAANWDPAGAPASGDTVEIGAAPNNPTLDTDAAVATVRVTGGSLVLNGHTLTVAGDFRTENGEGTLTMQQPDDTLRVLGTAVFQGGPTLDLLTDGVLFVRGDFLQRNFADTYGAFEATGDHLTVLNGTTPQRVRPEGDLQFGHLELANTAGQVTGEYDPAFNENEIEVEGKLRFATAVAFEGGELAIDVEDSLIISANSSLASRSLRLSGGMRVAGTLSVAVVEFAGDDQEIQHDVAYQDVRVTDGPRLTGTTVFAGSLVISNDGRLDLNGHALTVASLDIGAGTFEGSLIMQHPGGQLTVLGHATFDGDTLPDLLTAGVLRIGGNLTVGTTSGRHLLRAGGTHRTLLNGTGVQGLRLEARATFGHLEIATAAGGRVEVALTDEVVAFTVEGELRVTTPVALDGEPAASYRFVSIDVQDSLVTAAGSALYLDHLTLRGGIALNGLLEAEHVEFAGVNQPVPTGIDYNHVTISGTAHLTAATTFRGFTLVRGPQANLRLAGRRLTVNGGFTLGGAGIPEGTLTMTQDVDSLIVLGDAAFAGASSVGLLTAGTLVVAGGVYGGDEPTSFQPAGTHRTVLNGTGPQTLDFPYPGAGQSRFNDLELANTSGGVWLRSDVHVAGQLRAASAAQTLTGIVSTTLSATGVDVARLTLDSVALAIGGGTITRVDSVTFQRQDRAAAQLVVTHPGAAVPFTFNGLRFLSPPSTGLFVSATDVTPADGAQLTLTLAGSTPADGSARTATAGGAVVNWTGGAPPAPGSFVATGSLVTERSGHASTLLQNGRALVVGGLTTTAELYDAATGGFTGTTGSLSVTREGLTATTLYDGRVLVTGGGQSASATTRTAELYDPATGLFALTDSLGDSIPVQARGRRYGTAVLLPDGRVIVTGGDGVANSVVYRLRSAESYSPISETFTVLASPARARTRHTASLLADGRVLVAGGQTNFNDFGDPHVEIYAPATNTWSDASAMNRGRNGHTATVLADGRILITGGSELRQNPGNRLRHAEIYDPATGLFTVTDSLAVRRQYHVATLLANGRVLITGGLDENNLPVTTAELYDPVAGTFATTGATATARSHHAALRLGDGRVLVTGGQGAGSSAELYIP